MLMIFSGYFTAFNRSKPIRTKIYVDKYKLNICKNLTNLHLKSEMHSCFLQIQCFNTYMISPANH